MTKVKKIKEIEERQKFIDVYTEFNNWLHSLGFKSKHTCTYMDVNYGWYDDCVDSLYGVEHYVHNILKLSIRFLRYRNEHKFLFVGGGYTFSTVYSLEETKKLILKNVRTLRDTKLKELNTLQNI